jgi:HIV Tat-specific factor 1
MSHAGAGDGQEKVIDGVRWLLIDGQWLPEAPPEDAVGQQQQADDIPDYLEVLRQKKAQEKMEDEMLAAGKLPPHLAAAEAKAERKRQRAKQKNTGVMISGLPPDTDAEELADWVTKYGGVIKKNPETRHRIVKLMHGEDGKFIGEALVVFFRPESVPLACNGILQGMEYTPGFPVTLKAAKREKKEGEAAQQKGQKKRDKRVKLYDQEKELDWDEEEEKVHVIVKHLFTLEEVREGGMDFFEELRSDLAAELGKMGKVKTLKIFQYNPEGVIAVKFEKAKGAIRCVERMHGRFFAGRQLECFYYDGFTNYDVKETDEDRERRIAKFGEWLGNAEEKNPVEEDDENKD